MTTHASLLPPSPCVPGICASWALLATSAWGVQIAHSNDMALHNANSSAAWETLSNPSLGAPPGAYPPDLAGDLYWKVLPGDRVLAHTGPDGDVMAIDGLALFLGDTDWSTEPWFYDALIGPALPSSANPGNLEPAFLQQGLTSEVFLSLGPSGLPDPCSLGNWCDPDGCVAGVPVGYGIDIQLGVPIVIPADGTAASDLAISWFYPGGMTIGSGSSACGPGSDFTLQNAHGTGETQADDLGGISAFGGWRVAGSGPTADPVTDAAIFETAFRERVLNVIADSGTGVGLELGIMYGGATNGLKLSAGSGQARLSYEIRAFQDAGVPNLAFAATGLSALPLPGVSVGGAALLVVPDAVLQTTVQLTLGAANPVIEAPGGGWGYPDGMAQFYSTLYGWTPVILDVPPSAVGLDLYSQGGVLHLTDGSAYHTNRVRTSLLP